MTGRMGLPLILIALLAAAPAGAQEKSAAPLEITADQTLEWHRNDSRYIARGNAMARQGDVQIAAETLTADYRASAESSMDIYRLSAAGGVTIESQGNVATGDDATYDIDTGLAVMTGRDLRLSSPDQVVTARERFEYRVTDGRLTAWGDAVVTRGADKLRADSVSALFHDDKATGKRVLKQLTADGNVVITTATETVRGSNGVYDAATNIATLSGGVRIERGPNVLEGDKAEVNLTTNVSRMLGGAAETGGRVRGVFYPGSEKPGAAVPAPEAVFAPPPVPLPLGGGAVPAPAALTPDPVAPDSTTPDPMVPDPAARRRLVAP